MPKLGFIKFDSRILDAARDGTLVVFAGAGVSVGTPSNLPSFKELAQYVARDTGAIAKDPLDRFLGELQHRGIPVHERAAERLSVPESKPTSLHLDLLQLFRSADRVRIVTTNFDLHFETAAMEVFGKSPDLYRAPALPLGNRFTGIVHVHGMLPHSQDLVLTDADFGRAYLTEGWARRFLVDVFRQYTVLFVGYSHDDVVMTYLARALPAYGVAGRFALTAKEGDWNLLGITPVRFTLGTGDAMFQGLIDGVRKLSELSSRGVIDWQTRLLELGEGAPPVDDEAVDEVEQALREVHTTRFLVTAAHHVEWIGWLHTRKHLDKLFGDSELDERDQLLANWLVQHFATQHPDEVFGLIAANHVRLNPWLWRALAFELGLKDEKKLDDVALERWVSILLATWPPETDRHSIVWLMNRCARQGNVALVLKLFFRFCQYRLSLKPNYRLPDNEDRTQVRRLDAECVIDDGYPELSDVWKDHLKPNLSAIAVPVVTVVTRMLEETHQELVTWNMAAGDWDPNSYHRSAIEPHEQDRFPEAIDVLIDAARDALEWLAAARPAVFDAWIEMANTSVPLLRRLAVHAITVHPSKSADERLTWILERIGIAGNMEHHEVYRAAALNYPAASDAVRTAMVGAVLAISLEEAFGWSAEKMTDSVHLDWLSWLLQSRPDCPIASAPLEAIKSRAPELAPSDHPDFAHWSGPSISIGSESPWSVEQLLAAPPGAQIEQLEAFKGTRFLGPDRNGLLAAIAQASKQQPQWGLQLIDALTGRSIFASDLWGAGVRGLQEAEMSADQWTALLAAASAHELHVAHARDIATLMYTLVKDGGKPFALDLLGQANDIALSIWGALDQGNPGEPDAEWLSHALNHPAGIIVQFWLNSLALHMRGKPSAERELPAPYKAWFSQVLDEPASKGGFGRALLASQLGFLSGLDDIWTRQHLVPLFTDLDALRFAQAWDGFLVWGTLNHSIVPDLLPAFVPALKRVVHPRRRRRFLEFYTGLAVFYADDPTHDLLPALLQQGSLDDRISFAANMRQLLQGMQPDVKQRLWHQWLERYWKMRVENVPVQLEPGEISKMFNWLPYLGDLFPDAVAIAVRSRTAKIDPASLLFQLRTSDLVSRFPEETARLLIYLCSYEVPHFVVADLGRVASRLPPLTPEIRQRLNESLARIGAQ